MKTVEKLGVSDLEIFQDSQLYKFTSDAILLSKFARVKKGDVVADFCAGSGVVGFYLYGLYPNDIKSVSFFEIQKDFCDLEKESISKNNLTEKFNVYNVAIQQIGSEFSGKFSLIVCNPPYCRVGSGDVSENPNIAMCRAETFLKLEELLAVSSKCVKFGGRVCLVHRADRLSDIFSVMRENNLEPKRLQVVSAKNKTPYLVLVEGVKGGKSGLTVLNQIEN